MKTIRKLHFWIGTLFAPTILFFALSGAFQVLGLHEGSGASPAIAKLAEIHKDQSISTLPERKPPAPRPEAATTAHQDAPKPAAHVEIHRSKLLVMWFVLMAVALMVSTGLGIYMAFAYKRDRVVIAVLLAVGILVPIVGMFV